MAIPNVAQNQISTNKELERRLIGAAFQGDLDTIHDIEIDPEFANNPDLQKAVTDFRRIQEMGLDPRDPNDLEKLSNDNFWYKDNLFNSGRATDLQEILPATYQRQIDAIVADANKDPQVKMEEIAAIEKRIGAIPKQFDLSAAKYGTEMARRNIIRESQERVASEKEAPETKDTKTETQGGGRSKTEPERIERPVVEGGKPTQPAAATKAQTASLETNLRRILGQDPNARPAPIQGPITRIEDVQQQVEANKKGGAAEAARDLTERMDAERQLQGYDPEIARLKTLRDSLSRTRTGANLTPGARTAPRTDRRSTKSGTRTDLLPDNADQIRAQQIANINNRIAQLEADKQTLTARVAEIDQQINPDSLGPVFGPKTKAEAEFGERTVQDRRAEIQFMRSRAVPTGTKINFSTKDWLKERKKDYNKAKQDAFYGLMATVTKPFAGRALSGLDAMDASLDKGGKWGLFKDASRSLYNSRPLGIVRLPINKFGNTKVGKWTGEKSRNGVNWLKDKGTRFDGWLSQKILSDRFLDRDVTTRNYYAGRRRLGAFSNIKFNLKNQYDEEKKKKKNSLQSVVAGKFLYEQTIGKLIHNIKQTVKLLKDVARTYSGVKWLTAQKNLLTSNISNKFWSGPLGKAAVTVQRISNGIGAVAKSLPSGITTAAAAALTTFALTGGIGLVPVAIAGLTGSVIHIAEKTLADIRPSKFDWVMRLQARMGGMNWEMQKLGMGDMMLMEGVNPITVRTRIHSLLKSFSWGTAGMAIGTLAGMLIPGLSPLVGAAGGFALGLGTKYAADRVMVNILSKVGGNPILSVISKMPFFETVGLIQSVPWLNTQLHGIKSGLMNLVGMKNDQYWKYFLNSWTPWKSPLTFLSNLTGAGITFHNGLRLWSWGKNVMSAANVKYGSTPMVVGGVAGFAAGSVIGFFIGLPFGGAGAVLGATIGGIVGGAAGAFIGSIVPWVGTTIGAFFGSFIGSTIGTLFGSWIDKITGQIVDTSKLLESLFGALSLFKGIIDLIKALNEKFDPTNALGLAMTIIFSVALLNEMVKNSSYIDQTENSSAQGIYAEKDPDGTGKTTTVKPNTQQVKQITVDCLKEESKLIINPKTATITDITVKGKYYQISTKYYKFINITKPSSGLAVDSTINKGRELGICY